MPALDVGAARLDNQADYAGAATALQPALDGSLFNWRSSAWLVTPNAGLEWTHSNANRTYSVRGHAAWSWISSFAETDPVLKFNESAGVYSIRAERVAPTGKRVYDRALGWVLHGGYAGFFGPNRNALGFTSVAETGLGLEAPLSTSPDPLESPYCLATLDGKVGRLNRATRTSGSGRQSAAAGRQPPTLS